MTALVGFVFDRRVGGDSVSGTRLRLIGFDLSRWQVAALWFGGYGRSGRVARRRIERCDCARP